MDLRLDLLPIILVTSYDQNHSKYKNIFLIQQIWFWPTFDFQKTYNEKNIEPNYMNVFVTMEFVLHSFLHRNMRAVQIYEIKDCYDIHVLYKWMETFHHDCDKPSS